MNVDDMSPATCSKEYEAAWNATDVPDPFDTSAAIEPEIVAKSIATVAIIIGLVAVDFM